LQAHLEELMKKLLVLSLLSLLAGWVPAWGAPLIINEWNAVGEDKVLGGAVPTRCVGMLAKRKHGTLKSGRLSRSTVGQARSTSRRTRAAANTARQSNRGTRRASRSGL
jgi:hypothetical protein